MAKIVGLYRAELHPMLLWMECYRALRAQPFANVGLGATDGARGRARGLWLACYRFGRAGGLGRVTIYIVVSFLAFVVILAVLQIGGKNDRS